MSCGSKSKDEDDSEPAEQGGTIAAGDIVQPGSSGPGGGGTPVLALPIPETPEGELEEPKLRVRIYRTNGFVGLSFDESTPSVDGYRAWTSSVGPSRVEAGEVLMASLVASEVERD